VLSAKDGVEAVQLFRATPREVDLVLMDVIIPNKTGNEAALEMRRIRGDVKIIFTSGYQYDLIHDKKLLDEGEQLLMKPLVPAEIAMKLRTALDDNAGN
jgi:CheY-like chemotaxis protein